MRRHVPIALVAAASILAALFMTPAVAEDTDPTPEDIIAFSRERLAHFKCPTSVEFVDALPRNPSGKILRRELREPYWEGKERGVN